MSDNPEQPETSVISVQKKDLSVYYLGFLVIFLTAAWGLIGYSAGAKQGHKDGYRQGVTEGKAQGLEAFYEYLPGLPVHNCDLDRDGTLLTFQVGDQTVEVAISPPVARPYELYNCNYFSIHNGTFSLFRVYEDGQVLFYFKNQDYQSISPAPSTK